MPPPPPPRSWSSTAGRCTHAAVALTNLGQTPDPGRAAGARRHRRRRCGHRRRLCRGRGRQRPRGRHARPRGLPAPPRRRDDRARAAPGARPRPRPLRSGPMAKQIVKLTVNGRADRGAGRAAHAADPFPARGAGAQGRAYRLRDQPLRRLHRRPRRPVGEVLHHVRGAGRRRRDRHRRGPGRRAASCIRCRRRFVEHHGLQCGFCTPGMLMRGYRLLQENPSPTEDEIRWGLSGNLCRCTGYQNIVKAVAARGRRDAAP